MADKFMTYEDGRSERRVDLAKTLTKMECHLKTLNSRQGTCDDDRKDVRDIAEGAKRKIDNHVLISKDREGRGRFTFVRITTVIGLAIAAVGIYVSWVFVCSPNNSRMGESTLSYVEKPLESIVKDFK